MKRIRIWVTYVLVVLVLRSELKERPHHPSPHSANPRFVAERLESLAPLDRHLEHLHDELVGPAEVLSPKPAQFELKALSVVTPLYNEGGSFSTWWSGRPSFWKNASIESIPIDDGSPDDTAARLATLRDASVKPVFLAANQGYSESARHGINTAAGGYVVIAEFDGLREVTSFEPLLEPLRGQSALLTVLVRRRSRKLSAGAGAWVIRLLVRLRLHVRLTDSYPVCWAVRGAIAKQLAKDLPPGDLFLGAVHWVARSGGRIIEVPFDACRGRLDREDLTLNGGFELHEDGNEAESARQGLQAPRQD